MGSGRTSGPRAGGLGFGAVAPLADTHASRHNSHLARPTCTLSTRTRQPRLLWRRRGPSCRASRRRHLSRRWRALWVGHEGAAAGAGAAEHVVLDERRRDGGCGWWWVWFGDGCGERLKNGVRDTKHGRQRGRTAPYIQHSTPRRLTTRTHPPREATRPPTPLSQRPMSPPYTPPARAGAAGWARRRWRRCNCGAARPCLWWVGDGGGGEERAYRGDLRGPRPKPRGGSACAVHPIQHSMQPRQPR